MDYAIKYWKENTDFEELKRRIGDKKIAIWGAFINGKQVRKILAENGFKVSFYIDGHKDACEYDNLPIRRPDKESEKDVYIFITVNGVKKEIVNYLNEWHLKEGDNYIYTSKIFPQVVITEYTGGGYKDCNGNQLECEDGQIQCRIEFKGYNNKVKIGRGFVAGKGTRVIVENESEVMIGNYVHLDEGVGLRAYSEGKIIIGNNCLCHKDCRIGCKGGKVHIGNNCSINERFLCGNDTIGSIVEMGNDCMVASDVSILPTGHSIINLETGENVVSKRQKYTKIGNHVWIGKNAVILHNASIGDGSIVGASSVVRLQTEKNCVIAGNPARIIKTNHTWDRRNDVEFEDV